MKNRQENTQEQQLLQKMKQSQFQIQQSSLLAMPLAQLEETVRDELADNPALEKNYEANIDNYGSSTAIDNTETSDTLDSIDNLDSFDNFNSLQQSSAAYDDSSYDPNDEPGGFRFEPQESAFGETLSLADNLKEQTISLSLNEQQHYVLDYLIDSLDDDGYLCETPDSIADTLAIYHGIDISDDEIKSLIAIVQQLDPPGLGTRTLQECLLLQAKRMELDKTVVTVLEKHFADLSNNRWDKIIESGTLKPDEVEKTKQAVRRLNPHPGRSISEGSSNKLSEIVPDFSIDVSDTGSVSFTINNGNLPALTVSPSFIDIIEHTKKIKRPLTRQEQEAFIYARNKVSAAQNFVLAIERRWQMLHDVMGTIINIQNAFFKDGDDASIVKMTLKDVADHVKVSQSTVSRVANEKYCDTPWGIFPLKHFFSQTSTIDSDGKEISQKQMLEALKNILEQEDKKEPYKDEQLVDLMTKAGYKCSRRTISKYRSLLGILSSQMRKI